MKTIVMAIKDRALAAFGRPLFFAAVGQGIRTFGDEINRVAPDNTMNAHPDDYDLWELGTFDDMTGEFELLVEQKQVAIGKNLKIT